MHNLAFNENSFRKRANLIFCIRALGYKMAIISGSGKKWQLKYIALNKGIFGDSENIIPVCMFLYDRYDMLSQSVEIAGKCISHFIRDCADNSFFFY